MADVPHCTYRLRESPNDPVRLEKTGSFSCTSTYVGKETTVATGTLPYSYSSLCTKYITIIIVVAVGIGISYIVRKVHTVQRQNRHVPALVQQKITVLSVVMRIILVIRQQTGKRQVLGKQLFRRTVAVQ